MSVNDFSEIVWNYSAKNGRDLPWRHTEKEGSFDPYKILVSEMMLQQTRVKRVIPKYHEFLNKFPTVGSLASARMGDVLVAWQGLGYNRRAKFLWQAAQKITRDYNGIIPSDQNELTKLPGVGVNTAGAISVYTFNKPLVFVETNIRTVYIHHFFEDREDVSDKELVSYIEETLDIEHPREWYWALMDYGTHLKTKVGNVSRQSKHYTKQSRFEGSKRQIRGAVLRLLAMQSTIAAKKLEQSIDDPRLKGVLTELIDEGMVVNKQGNYSLA